MLTRILILGMFLATACTPNAVPSSFPSQEVVDATEEPLAATSIPSPVAEEGLQKKSAEMALDDLAGHLSVKREVISVVSSESVTWPDSALGCPTPDKVYSRVKVSGFRILLKVNGQVYDYHTDRTGRVVLCLEPEVKPSEPGLR